MKYLLAILAFAGIASAQNAVIFDSRISPRTNTNVRSIDLAVKARELNPDLYDWTNSGYFLPSVVPALVNPRVGVWVSITGTLQAARADLRQAVSDYREQFPEWRNARQEWNQVRRQTATALGLPATNGLAWTVYEAYANATLITNATTRSAYLLRVLQADVNQTRHQLEQKFPNIQFWWEPGD